MKARLAANALAFLVLGLGALRYIQHYESWWFGRGRAAFLQFQANYYDRSIATHSISHSLLAVVLLVTLFYWVLFEVCSRALLRLFRRLSAHAGTAE